MSGAGSPEATSVSSCDWLRLSRLRGCTRGLDYDTLHQYELDHCAEARRHQRFNVPERDSLYFKRRTGNLGSRSGSTDVLRALPLVRAQHGDVPRNSRPEVTEFVID